MPGLLDPPDLPELQPASLQVDRTGTLRLEGALVDVTDGRPADASGPESGHPRRIVIRESELRGVTLSAPKPAAFELRDVRLRGCDLSNAQAVSASVWRVEVVSSRLLGFHAAEADIRELRITDSSLALATFAFAQLRHVSFERVDLSEATFMNARLDGVEFVDCRLSGADFRNVRLAACAIRGTSLDGVLGVDSLRGLRMPWADVIDSVAALSAALGIEVESDDD